MAAQLVRAGVGMTPVVQSWQVFSLEDVKTRDGRQGRPCWVVIEGGVYDVTEFATRHPGGRDALTKAGRAGCDCTEAFRRIGHSKAARGVLASLRVGAAACDARAVVAPTPSKRDEEARGAAWHGARRAAMLDDEARSEALANLARPSLFGLALGLGAAAAHAAAAFYARGLSWPLVLALSYTIGSLCKMYQFSSAHELCHGNVFGANRVALARAAMHLVTLPSVGGTVHSYYAAMHLGHHVILGDITKSSVAPTAHGFTVDGDIFSVNTWSLVALTLTGGAKGTVYATPCVCLWRWPLLRRLVTDPLWHLGHFFALLVLWDGMILVGAIFGGLALVVASPVLFAAVLAGRLLPPVTEFDGDARAAALLALDVGVHSLLWASSALALVVAPRGGCPWKATVYLVLSELFLYGFCFHPFAGYFLSVHRCDHDPAAAAGVDSGLDPALYERQPTTSTYSTLASLASANLNLHVEHHDFPTVPCHRLHRVRALFPEFYEPLRHSTGFVATVVEYLRHGGDWSYSCDELFHHNFNFDKVQRAAETVHAEERRRLHQDVGALESGLA